MPDLLSDQDIMAAPPPKAAAPQQQQLLSDADLTGTPEQHSTMGYLTNKAGQGLRDTVGGAMDLAAPITHPLANMARSVAGKPPIDENGPTEGEKLHYLTSGVINDQQQPQNAMERYGGKAAYGAGAGAIMAPAVLVAPLPAAAGVIGSSMLGGAMSGATEEGMKDLGAPEWAQKTAGLAVGALGPGALGRTIRGAAGTLSPGLKAAEDVGVTPKLGSIANQAAPGMLENAFSKAPGSSGVIKDAAKSANEELTGQAKGIAAQYNPGNQAWGYPTAKIKMPDGTLKDYTSVDLLKDVTSDSSDAAVNIKAARAYFQSQSGSKGWGIFTSDVLNKMTDNGPDAFLDQWKNMRPAVREAFLNHPDYQGLESQLNKLVGYIGDTTEGRAAATKSVSFKDKAIHYGMELGPLAVIATLHGEGILGKLGEAGVGMAATGGAAYLGAKILTYAPVVKWLNNAPTAPSMMTPWINSLGAVAKEVPGLSDLLTAHRDELRARGKMLDTQETTATGAGTPGIPQATTP